MKETNHNTEYTETADTDRIQKAIEKVVDEETGSIPPLPLDREMMNDSDHTNSEVIDSKSSETSAHTSPKAQVHAWFFTFMCMNIPIVGWIYLFHLAFNKKRTDRREFARAYLFYKLVFLLVSAVILGILIYIGMGLLDQLLAYMEML